MATPIVRLSPSAHQTLCQLSKRTGRSMQSLLDDAIEALRRERLLDETNAAFAALKRDPKAWKAELEERRAWDATLTDGLEDD